MEALVQWFSENLGRFVSPEAVIFILPPALRRENVLIPLPSPHRSASFPVRLKPAQGSSSHIIGIFKRKGKPFFLSRTRPIPMQSLTGSGFCRTLCAGKF